MLADDSAEGKTVRDVLQEGSTSSEMRPSESVYREVSWKVSHEIRSSLVRILTLIDSMDMNGLDDKYYKVLKSIKQAADTIDLNLKSIAETLGSLTLDNDIANTTKLEGKSWKIFIVDDDPVMSRIAVKQVNSFDLKHEILSYQSGRDVVDYLQSYNEEDAGDLMIFLLLDINMPEVNGWEVLEAISREKLGPKFQVVMYSSSVCPNERSRAMKYPFVRGFIEKPMSKRVLEEFFYSLRLM